MKLHEVHNPKQQEDKLLEDAMWWVQRWISGSMRNPEWDASTNQLTLDQAFHVVQRTIKPSVPPLLWRYIVVNKDTAQKIITHKRLPQAKYRYQSFTVSRNLAIEVGQDINPYTLPKGKVGLLISAKIPHSLVMFNTQDLFENKNRVIRNMLAPLSDWEHQQEVVVKVDVPLQLHSAEIIAHL